MAGIINKRKQVRERRRLALLTILRVAGQLSNSGLDAGDTGLDGCERTVSVWSVLGMKLLTLFSTGISLVSALGLASPGVGLGIVVVHLFLLGSSPLSSSLTDRLPAIMCSFR